MTGAPPLLEVTDLHAGYGTVPILHGVDVSVAEGRIVGIVGPNGTGKTTLLRAVIGQVPATAGAIRFDGRDMTRVSSHGRARLGLGYVPQGRGIFPTLTVRDNLRMGLVAHAANEDDAIAGMLDEFPQLAPLLSRQGGALSGGEQQLLALARCLIGAPRLLLLDEPTEGIQPSIVDIIEDKLRELVAARRLSILLVEQNLSFITSLSDRVLSMKKGLIVDMSDSGLNLADHSLYD